MEKEVFSIDGIPAVIWGNNAQKVIIAVHGSKSNKMDVPIEVLTKNAEEKGYQVLSFELTEHGDRKNEGILWITYMCNVLYLGRCTNSTSGMICY